VPLRRIRLIRLSADEIQRTVTTLESEELAPATFFNVVKSQ
jgi:hypothetical protein